MIAPSFNFDLGVKNYKKNRLIVDKIHLKNEILYNIEKTKKTSFNISAFSYLNENNLNFLDAIRDLKASSLDNTFNFFINKNGNLFTDVEMSSDSYFYPERSDELNVVVCFSGSDVNPNNEKTASSIYRFNQLKTFTGFIKTFRKNAYNVNFKPLEIDNSYEKITNLGFDISSFVTERPNND